ncbi:Hypothetical protein NTJ_03989 [Nesidiocoris tenuis]|uniref:Uncharacterized protein n=1 Tax=Nesidiocoris tenuis TaxID=355587 RepID=A0ABN7AFY0_9HEMI|nr:Hypothetical protein NTJ_03989 [Nesidiocoris tenuis]
MLLCFELLFGKCPLPVLQGTINCRMLSCLAGNEDDYRPPEMTESSRRHILETSPIGSGPRSSPGQAYGMRKSCQRKPLGFPELMVEAKRPVGKSEGGERPREMGFLRNDKHRLPLGWENLQILEGRNTSYTVQGRCSESASLLCKSYDYL